MAGAAARGTVIHPLVPRTPLGPAHDGILASRAPLAPAHPPCTPSPSRPACTLSRLHAIACTHRPSRLCS
ncbi:hypothetical protein DENSPDRAFT_835236, partial [Dentipellis sp. KUC8613]